ARWHPAVSLPAPPPLYLFTRALSRSILRLWSGLEGPDARHVPRTGGLMVAANHRSYLDAFLLAAVYPRPIAFLSTSEAFRPLWQRLFLNGLGCIRLRRFAPDPHAIRRVLRAVRSGAAVGIFPEGERSWDGGPGPLLPGVARLLELTGVPVHPVRLEGSYRLWPRWGRGPRRARVGARWGEPLENAPARELGPALVDALRTRPDPPTSRNRSAADVGRLIWRCPSCGHPDAIRGRRDGGVWCLRCGGSGHLFDGTHLDWQGSGPLPLREWARRVALTRGERRELACGPDPPRHWPFLRLSDGEGDLPLKSRGKGEAVLTPEALVLRSRGWRAYILLSSIRSVTVEGSHKLQVATRRRIYELRYRRGSPRGPRIHLEALLDARGIGYRRG
ncbi:MAG: lysophospholipid acyltransferase family protein, partial [bacterium]